MRRQRQAVALAAVLVAVVQARADDLPGPRFGNARSSSSIDTVFGEEDEDAYGESLIAGEALRVTLTVPRKSTLVPRVRICGPLGESGPDVVVKRDGRRLEVPRFEVPSTGRWTVVVSGDQGSEGAYKLSTHVRKLGKQRFRDLPVGGAQGEQVPFAFEAVADARCTLRVRAARELQPRILELLDPGGRDLPGEEADTAVEEARVSNGGSVHKVRHVPVPEDGTYDVTVGIAAGTEGTYDVVLQVRPRGRPKGRKRYEADLDPFLDPRGEPLAGGEGSIVRLTGANLSRDAAAPPRVLFGERGAPVAAVDPAGGAFVDVLVPAAPAIGAVVPVTVGNPDGQTTVRDAYFRFEAAGLADLSPVTAPPVSGADDFSAYRGAVADLDGDGHADDLVLVSPGDPAVSRTAAFLGPGDVVTFTADGQTTTPGDIAAVAEEDTFSFTLSTAGWVVLTTDLPGTLGDAALSLLGPTTADTLVAAADDDHGGPAEALRMHLDAGTWFVRVGGVGGATGAYTLRGRHHPGSQPPPGTRRGRMRLLLGDVDGSLTDASATNLPAEGLYSSYSASAFHAHAVALGDLDGDDVAEIVIGGFAPGYAGDYEAYSNAYSDVVGQVQVLRNDGYGTFTQVPGDLPPGIGDRLDVYGVDEQARAVPILVAYRSVAGFGVSRPPPTALAVGDVDGDGDDDVVAGFSEALAGRSAVLDFSRVDASVYPAFVPSAALDVYDGEFYPFNPVYLSATQVLLNRIDEGLGLEYATALRMPVLEPSLGGPVTLPGFHARDVALGDLDGDDDLDMVLTWDDPTSVTIYGALYPQTAPVVAESPLYGTAFDEPRTSTRVLLNDGFGTFADVTDDWLPDAGAPEFWQAHRMALADLDDDDDLDLVLVHREGVEAYLARPLVPLSATPHADTTSPGRIAGASEVDRFEVEVTERSVIELLLEPKSLRSGEVALLDGDENLLTEGFAGFGFPGRAYALVDAGTYFVDIRGPGPGQGGATGDYEIFASRLLPPQPVPHARHALRVLRNDGDKKGFVDVTAAVLPPVDTETGEDLRGEALLVADVNGDGALDLVVGTREPLETANGAPAASTRLLLGSPSFVFTATSADFLPDPALESGEASDLLLGDLGATGDDAIFLFSERRPRASAGGGYLRALSPR